MKIGARAAGIVLIGLGAIVLGTAVFGLASAAFATARRGTIATPPDVIAQVESAPPVTRLGLVARSATAVSTRPLATPAAAVLGTSVIATPDRPKATPVPAPAPRPALPPATHIAVPAVGIDTRIVEVGYQVLTVDGQHVLQWQVAAFAAGHNSLSANPGEGGNIVITGHDDWKGEVFKNLAHVKVGDQVTLTTPAETYRYAVTEIHYRGWVGASIAQQLAVGAFLAPMPQERVTLVTFWPYGVDTDRLIVVARPIKP